ncbi:MAG: sugar phosphate nucleotidyltransferase [Clostridia bacterium]|nr:sugar phosphate nucleotidyltransferase [Clostridia bacterium]
MNGKTLVIMAAGMGSRYGGNKQVTGFGPTGEWLCEYSAYDAMRAGFDKIVFIIKPEMLAMVKQKVEGHMDAHLKVEYAFQDFTSLPSFYRVPEGRVKPFGTVHAVLCAAPYIDGPFAVLNADDYYGKDAFVKMAACLDAIAPEGEAAMVAYSLRNTVSAHGTVTRGICGCEGGKLVSVKETKKIGVLADGSIADVEQDPPAALDPDALVSMNLWGYTPWMLATMKESFEAFLRQLPEAELKGELLLPVLVNQYMQEGRIRVSVSGTDSNWFGVTYQEDRPKVVERLQALHDAGEYPTPLW